jgi:hypothetical protein
MPIAVCSCTLLAITGFNGREKFCPLKLRPEFFSRGGEHLPVPSRLPVPQQIRGPDAPPFRSPVFPHERGPHADLLAAWRERLLGLESTAAAPAPAHTNVGQLIPESAVEPAPGDASQGGGTIA